MDHAEIKRLNGVALEAIRTCGVAGYSTPQGREAQRAYKEYVRRCRESGQPNEYEYDPNPGTEATELLKESSGYGTVCDCIGRVSNAGMNPGCRHIRYTRRHVVRRDQ